jgi:hypothetical protein
MNGNANPRGEFGEHCIHFKRSARACCRADLSGLGNMASITRSILSGVRAENGGPCGLLSSTDPS